VKRKRKKPVSATQKSLKKLRDEGYLCEIVEKTIPKCFIKKDLFGFIDILAIKGREVLAVQTTANLSNANARVKKILEHENYQKVKKLGWKIVVHGWRQLQGKYKNGNKKIYWDCKEIYL
jgi:c-di-GMP-related signal transduction protein